jgi:Ni,Fe-hydrogenase III large subunit
VTIEEPVQDYADVIGRLLVRVYEIHERVLIKGGGGLEGIRFCVEVAEEAMRQAQGEPVQPKTIAEIAAWFRELVESPSV